MEGARTSGEDLVSQGWQVSTSTMQLNVGLPLAGMPVFRMKSARRQAPASVGPTFTVGSAGDHQLQPKTTQLPSARLLLVESLAIRANHRNTAGALASDLLGLLLIEG